MSIRRHLNHPRKRRKAKAAMQVFASPPMRPTPKNPPPPLPVPKVANEEKILTVSTMPMTVAEVVEETSRWPTDQVDVLFDQLLASRYRLPDPALDVPWAEELKRRIDDIESGREVGIPGEEVMARVRKLVGL